MDFVDSAGIRYQLVESAEALGPTKKTPVWPWVVGGLALAGGLVWMASSTSRKANPVDHNLEALIVEARDPETSFERLVRLAEHREIEVRRALLDNPNVCPTKTNGMLDTRLLQRLAEEFPEEVAAHPVFVLHALIEPTEDVKWVVRVVVRKIADVGLIERLLNTCGPISWLVRQAVARNPMTPMEIFRTLGNQQTENENDVRFAVASNLSTPVDVLRTLGNEATENDWSIRQGVAENPNTPVDVLRSLNNKKTESIVWVRQAAQKALADRSLA